MKSLYLVIIFSSATFLANAQFGFAAKYNSNSYGDWNDVNEQIFDNSDKIFSNDIELSANYWFRLKEKRIEFLPEIFYNIIDSENKVLPDLTEIENNHSRFGLNINTHIYFMDLSNDCNCPTFSKDGGNLQKAFHLILSPGLVYNSSEVVVNADNISFDNSGLAFKFGAGLGFDIGVNDLLTISPFFMINYSSSYSSAAYREMNLEYNPFSSFGPVDASLFQTQLGIRVGLRPDYVKRF